MSYLPYHSCILIRSSEGGIGCDNKMPWNFPADRRHFYEVTTANSAGKANILVMGKNTWLSLGRRLKKRINIVISSTLDEKVVNADFKEMENKHNKPDKDSKHDNPNKDKPDFKEQNLINYVRIFDTLEKASNYIKTIMRNRYVFIIGGTKLFQASFRSTKLESLYLTTVHHNLDKDPAKYDAFFNNPVPKRLEIDNSYNLLPLEIDNSYNLLPSDYTLKLTCYKRNNVSSSASEYTDLLMTMMYSGSTNERKDRTQIGTLSIFGQMIRIDISKRYPLVTTKDMSFRIVFKELMWMIRGQTNSKILAKDNIHIWDKNSSKENLAKLGFDYPEGELGPIYGHQWRHFGGDYPLTTDKPGFDQLMYVINGIKNDPTSRRLIVSAWNPADLHKMVLPPCHFAYQFYVRSEYLDIKFDMRSCDVFLGLPYNIASYALLTYMIAALTGLKPGMLTCDIADAHIYKNHVVQVKEQLERPDRDFPTLTVKSIPNRIEDFTMNHFVLNDYYPHPSIPADMAV